MILTKPVVFEPLFMERVWGGRKLESVFAKKLPPDVRVGEAWELVDREEVQSVVHTGVLQGKTLNELWVQYREPVFGARYQGSGSRFPLLVKLLDAEERLSVQVHPPAAVAPQLGGEPKTEMWFVASAAPDADIFAGLRAGTSRADFEHALSNGTVADLLHRLPTRAGDCIFIPSGRIHAIGAGNVIVEIQQNSDTTYRVFDWNRTGLDGKPRALHVPESMLSIDFEDVEPAMQPRGAEPLVDCDYFRVQHWALDAPRKGAATGDFSIIAVLSGTVGCAGDEFGPGEFFLIPATLPDPLLTPVEANTTLLRTTIPPSATAPPPTFLDVPQ